MPKKRKSGGRRKGSKGRGTMVQCSACGKQIARDKAARVTKTVKWIDPALARELREKGAYLPRSRASEWYCIKCAVHRGITPPRAKEKRRGEEKNMKCPRCGSSNVVPCKSCRRDYLKCLGCGFLAPKRRFLD